MLFPMKNGKNVVWEVLHLIVFIKNHSFESLKRKLIMLYVLNLTDLLFTLLLLSTGYFMEANIFMVSTVASLPKSFLLKIIFPAVLLLYVFYRLQSANERQRKRTNILISGMTGVYLLINISHLLWLALLPLFILND